MTTLRMPVRVCTVITTMVVLAGVPTAAQRPRYAITDVGTLGGSRSVAVGINNHGHVVGNADTATGEMRAFFAVDGLVQDLGTLGGRASHAGAINDKGLIVGRAQDGNGVYHSFIRLKSGQMWNLSVIDSQLDLAGFSAANSVNAAGQVVGYIHTQGPHMAARSKAFVFNEFRVTNLGTFGGPDGVVSGINDAAQMVGFYGTEPHADYADHRAFIKTGSTVTPLGSLGGRTTTPTDINNDGHVVGSGQVRGGEERAFLYAGGKLNDLGTLPGGTQSFAYAINHRGQAVGAADAAGSLRAVLYEAGKVIDLNTLIPVQSGWVLTEARDINDKGQITGTGTINGRQRAFVLTPVR